MRLPADTAAERRQDDPGRFVLDPQRFAPNIDTVHMHTGGATWL